METNAGTRDREDDWVADLICAKPQEKSLAEITGLKVKVEW